MGDNIFDGTLTLDADSGSIVFKDLSVPEQVSRIQWYTGDPSGVVSAPSGALCLTPVGTFQNVDGGTTWVALNTVAPTVAPGTLFLLEIPVTIVDVASNTDIPNTNLISMLTCVVAVPYDPGATLEVGTALDPDLLVAAGDVDLQTQGAYPMGAGVDWPGGTVRVRVGGNPGMGALRLLVWYAEPVS